MANSPTPNDLKLWKAWKQGGQVPLSGDDQAIAVEWAGFPAGTPRLQVWHWFDRTFSMGLFNMIGIMCPEVKTSFNLASMTFETHEDYPPQQTGMFESSDDDDWGDSKKTRQSGQNRLF